MSDETAYNSRVRIERLRGPVRRAWLPAEDEPVTFGVHSEVASHYGIDPASFPPRATTLDYVVAAAGGWLTGTLAGALEARGVELEEGDLTAEVEGRVAKDGKVLVIRSIRVVYDLQIPAAQRGTAERVHEFHAGFCPVARTLAGCVRIETELSFRS